MKILEVQRIADRIAEEFGVIGLKVCTLKDSSVHTANANALALEVSLSEKILGLSKEVVLAVLAHEVAHVSSCHYFGSSHLVEYQADELAVEILEFLGYSKQTLLKVFSEDVPKMLEADGEKDFNSSSHPSFKNRAEAIKALK